MLDKENSRKKFAFRKEKERLRTTGHKSCVMEEKKILTEKTSRLTKCQKKIWQQRKETVVTDKGERKCVAWFVWCHFDCYSGNRQAFSLCIGLWTCVSQPTLAAIVETRQEGSCGHFQSEAGAAAWRQKWRHQMRMSAGEQDNYGTYR